MEKTTIRIRTVDSWVEVEGYKMDSGMPGVSLAVHKSYKAPGWTVTELSTGLSVCKMLRTRKAAMERARSILEEKGHQKVQEAIFKQKVDETKDPVKQRKDKITVDEILDLTKELSAVKI